MRHPSESESGNSVASTSEWQITGNDDTPSYEIKINKSCSNGPSTTTHPSNGPSATTLPSNDPSTITHPSNGRSTTTHPSNGPSTTTHPSNGPSTTTHPSNGPCTTTQPSNGPSTTTHLNNGVNSDRNNINGSSSSVKFSMSKSHHVTGDHDDSKNLPVKPETEERSTKKRRTKKRKLEVEKSDGGGGQNGHSFPTKKRERSVTTENSSSHTTGGRISPSKTNSDSHTKTKKKGASENRLCDTRHDSDTARIPAVRDGVDDGRMSKRGKLVDVTEQQVNTNGTGATTKKRKKKKRRHSERKFRQYLPTHVVHTLV